MAKAPFSMEVSEMHHLMEKVKRGRGFTLVELLVVVVVLAVLAAIVLPKFMDSGNRSKESAQKSDMKIVKNAIELFHADTGYYPNDLADLTRTSAASVNIWNGSSSTTLGTASDYHGPYLESVPNDPVKNVPFTYDHATGGVTAP